MIVDVGELQLEVQEHQGKSLRYLTIHPDDYRADESYPLVILLHGFGASMGDLAGLTPAIDKTGYVYACPNAPVAFQVGPGMMGYGWGAIGGDSDPDERKHVKEMLGVFIDEVIEQYHIPDGQIIIGGFSQGAGMAYMCGLPRPDQFAGVAALSSSKVDFDDLKEQIPADRTQSVFIAHGTEDPVSPVERARTAKAFLEGEGYPLTYHEYPMAHEITTDVVDDLVLWVHQVLPPLNGASTTG